MKFYILYIYRFCKTLTIRKVLNWIQLNIDFCISIILRKSYLKAFPFSVSIEPTNLCNLKCPECITGNDEQKRTKGTMNMLCFQSIIEKIYKKSSFILLYAQGEPFFNKDFLQMVTLAKKKNLFISTSTNGHFLTKETCNNIINSRLDHIIISLDGANQETYEKYRRRGSFNTVTQGIQNLTEVKKVTKSHYPLVEIQFIVFRHNENEIKEILSLGKKLGADKVTLKTAQIYHFQKDGILPPTQLKYSRYTQIEGKYKKKTKDRKHCLKQWSSSIITQDGIMALCCMDKDAEMSYGNVKENDFQSIWLGEKAQNTRTNLMQNRLPNICKECPIN